MPQVTIERDRCKGCELCVEACPEGVLDMTRDLNARGYFFAAPVRPWNCIGCRLCVVACPDVAVSLRTHGTQYVFFRY